MTNMNTKLNVLAVFAIFVIYKLFRKPSEKPEKSLKLITASYDLKGNLQEIPYKTARIIYISIDPSANNLQDDMLNCSTVEGKRHIINHLKPNLHLDTQEIELKVPLEIVRKRSL